MSETDTAFDALYLQIDTLKTAANNAESASLREYSELATTAQALKEQNAELLAQIDILKNRRPGEVILSKHVMQNVCMVICVKDDTPGKTQDDMTRSILRASQAIGANSWRGFLSKAEVDKHTSFTYFHTDSDLFWYGQQRGLTGIADTVDNPALNLTADNLKKYFDGLMKLGVIAAVVNDADDSQKKPPDVMAKIMDALHTALKGYPDFPLIASCSANVDCAGFRQKWGFDFIEIQTFHSNGDELKGMLKKPADVFCLDTQVSMSNTALKEQTAIVASNAVNVGNIALYAGHDYDGTDFRKMGWVNEKITASTQVAYIDDMVMFWKQARGMSIT